MGHKRTTRVIGLAASVLAASGAAGHGGVALADAAAPTTTDAYALIDYLLAAGGSEEAFAGLSEAQQKAVVDVLVPVVDEEIEARTTVEYVALQPSASADAISSAAVAGETCWNNWHKRRAKALAGNVIGTYWQGLRVCAKNGKITSGRVYDRGGETSTPGWSYRGKTGSGEKNYGDEYRAWTQEKFVLSISVSIGPVSVDQDIQTMNKCIRNWVNAKGGKGSNGSCGLGR
jgi:hypothetical protein